MAEGIDAVKAALVRDFGAIKIDERYDSSTQEVLLDFRADKELDFRVRVSREYDEDYASGQVKVDLRRLGEILRASHSGRVQITRVGIISK
jgi:hypothetical protein